MPPKSTAVQNNQSVTIPRTAFLPFNYNRLRDLMARRDTPNGENAVLIYLMSSLKQCNGFIYFRLEVAEGENVQLLHLPIRKFIEQHLTSFKDKGINVLLNLAHRPFTTFFNPRMPLIDNHLYKINLYEPSPYAYVTPDYLPNGDLLVTCENFLSLLCGEDPALTMLVGSAAWKIVNGTRLFWALVFTGEQSTGKSTFCTVLKSLIPSRLFSPATSDQLGKNNGMIVSKSLVVFEEFTAPIPDELIRTLLNLVNGTEVVAQEKYVAAYSAENFANFIFNSNQDLSALNGRRYCHIHPKTINPTIADAFSVFCQQTSDTNNNRNIIEHFYFLFRNLANKWDSHCISNNLDPSKVPKEYTVLDRLATLYQQPIDPRLVFLEFFCDKLMTALVDKKYANGNVYWPCAALATEYIEYCSQYAMLNPNYSIPGTGIADKKRTFYSWCEKELLFSKVKSNIYYYFINGHVIYDYLLNNLDIKNKARIDLYNLGTQNGVPYGASKNVEWNQSIQQEEDMKP